MSARLFLVVALLAACRTVPLSDPTPVACAVRPDVTPLAIHRGLLREGFEIIDETPGRTRASLSRGNWTMIVEVTYTKEVAINYVDSESLGFRNRHDGRYIHHAYNDRAQRLADSIDREARIILAEVDPDAFLGPGVGAPPPPAESAH